MYSKKLLSGAMMGALALLATTPSRAATLEDDKSGSWTLNAYSDDKTGAFQSCTMTAPADHEVSLVFTLTGSLTWTMWLYKQNWAWGGDKEFIGTVNIDKGRKAGVAFDASVNGPTLIAFKGADFQKLFAAMRSGRQLHAMLNNKNRFVFPISGTREAINWVTECAKRYQDQVTARNPQKQPDDDDSYVNNTKPTKPTRQPDEIVPTKPNTNGPLINAQNDPAQSKPNVQQNTQTQVATNTPTTPTTPQRDNPTVQPTQPTQPAQLPTTTTIDATATAPNDLPANTRATDARMAAMSFLPRLMAEANRPDFKILEPKDVPARVKKADLVFSFNGLIGTVLVTDFATAKAASNELLAMDNIACTGAATSGVDPDKDGRVDVSHAFDACDVGGKTSMARYTALSRKDGGYFVVGVIDDGSGQSPMTFQEVDAALFNAALKLSGKF